MYKHKVNENRHVKNISIINFEPYQKTKKKTSMVSVILLLKLCLFKQVNKTPAMTSPLLVNTALWTKYMYFLYKCAFLVCAPTAQFVAKISV